MSRTAARVTQADIARVLRAYRNEGVSVRTRLMPDGSTSFEPIVAEKGGDAAANDSREKEIVL
jgi:hypothetical protein